MIIIQLFLNFVSSIKYLSKQTSLLMCVCLYNVIDVIHGYWATRGLPTHGPEMVFCGMRTAECGKLSRGNLRKIRCGFFCGMKGKVRNETTRNVAEMNIY